MNFCKKNSSMSFFSIDINSARMCSILSMSIPLLPGILLKLNSLDYIFLGITDEKYCGRRCFPFFKFLVWQKVGCSLLFPKCKKNKKLQLQKLKLASYHKTPSVEKNPTHLPLSWNWRFSWYFEYRCHSFIKNHNQSLCGKKWLKNMQVC